MSTNKGKNIKKRHWAFVLYPESAPDDWKHQLQMTGLPCAISPLHDNDVNPTGEPKKAHYHIILCYNGPTTFNAVKTFTESLNQPIPQPLDSVSGMYRYLTHDDNPEKAQYNKDDILQMNGFNVADYTDLTRSEVLEVKIRLQLLIRQENILEYSDLMDLLQDSGMNLEYEIASNHTYFFDKYIASRRNKSKHIDFATGELRSENLG